MERLLFATHDYSDCLPGPHPLNIAFQQKNTEIIQLLTESRIFAPNCQAFLNYRAIAQGNTEAVQLLLSAGAQVNVKELGVIPDKWITPLDHAIDLNNSDLVKILFRPGQI